MNELPNDDFGIDIELSEEMTNRIKERDRRLEEDRKDGKIKPPDSPFECEGCGS